MRRLLLAALLLAPPLAAQQREIRGFRANADVALRLWVPAGFVEVVAWDRDSVEVRATPAKGTRVVGGGTVTGGKYALEGIVPSDSILPSAQLRVYVPHQAKLWIKSTVASVHVRGTRNQLEVLQVSGGTRVEDVEGTVTLESIDGAADVASVRGVLRVRGGSAPVSLQDVTGSLDVSMVSGRVTMVRGTRVDAPELPLRGRVETVGGGILYMGAVIPGSQLEFVSHDGVIQLVLVDRHKVRIDDPPPSAEIDPRILTSDPKAGRIVLRTFKGRINVGAMAGI